MLAHSAPQDSSDPPELPAPPLPHTPKGRLPALLPGILGLTSTKFLGGQAPSTHSVTMFFRAVFFVGSGGGVSVDRMAFQTSSPRVVTRFPLFSSESRT